MGHVVDRRLVADNVPVGHRHGRTYCVGHRVVVRHRRRQVVDRLDVVAVHRPD